MTDDILQNFKKKINLVGLEVKNNELIPSVMKVMNGMLFTHRGVQSIKSFVIEEKEQKKKIKIMFISLDKIKFCDVFLIIDKSDSESLDNYKIMKNVVPTKNIVQISFLKEILFKIRNNEDETTKFQENKNWLNENFKIHPIEIIMTHENFTISEVLADILPKNIIIPTSYEQIGHIAHLNLLDSQLPYKNIIGNIFLEMSRKSGIRTVVNKTDALTSEFRELPLEIIAGENNLTAEVKQHGIPFLVPFDKVYWNSRLEFEHKRFVDSLSENDILYDVMSGVGPFAIPAALKGMSVFANDLNPTAIHALRYNWEKNKKTLRNKNGSLISYNMDGRDFIEMIRKEHLVNGPEFIPDPKNSKKRIIRTRHFVMNLPALAVTFLDTFTGTQWNINDNPNMDTKLLVHVYLFSYGTTIEIAKNEGIKQVAENLKLLSKDNEIPDFWVKNIIGIYYVRDVSPSKYMFLISFTIPSIIFEKK